MYQIRHNTSVYVCCPVAELYIYINQSVAFHNSQRSLKPVEEARNEEVSKYVNLLKYIDYVNISTRNQNTSKIESCHWIQL
jgi:hypothetical protein